MTSASRTVATLAAAAMGAGVLIAAAPTAGAANGVERYKYGTCTQGSTWKLELEREHGLIEVDFDAETRKPRIRWAVRIMHKRVKKPKKWIYKSTTLSDRKGEVDVDRHLKNRKGKDRVVVRVKSKATGEICRASLKI